jgi:hypothetical protein
MRHMGKRIDGLPKLVALKRTSIACPSQWEGDLEDGRAIYIRYRHGHLSVGTGNDIDEAVRNGKSDQALFADDMNDALDGFMDLEELAVNLHGLLEFPPDLIVENEQPPRPSPGILEELPRPQSD